MSAHDRHDHAPARAAAHPRWIRCCNSLHTGVSPPVSVEVFVVGPDAVARDATSCVEVLRAALP